MALGIPIGELKRRMAHTEFIEWAAYAEIEPIGEARADWRHAQLMALIANTNRDGKKRAYKAQEFLMDWWKRAAPAPSADGVVAKFRAIAERINANNGKS